MNFRQYVFIAAIICVIILVLLVGWVGFMVIDTFAPQYLGYAKGAVATAAVLFFLYMVKS